MTTRTTRRGRVGIASSKSGGAGKDPPHRRRDRDRVPGRRRRSGRGGVLLRSPRTPRSCRRGRRSPTPSRSPPPSEAIVEKAAEPKTEPTKKESAKKVTRPPIRLNKPGTATSDREIQGRCSPAADRPGVPDSRSSERSREARRARHATNSRSKSRPPRSRASSSAPRTRGRWRSTGASSAASRASGRRTPSTCTASPRDGSSPGSNCPPTASPGRVHST